MPQTAVMPSSSCRPTRYSGKRAVRRRMTSPQAREPINGNLREGQEHGVQSTPTVFINGRTVLGAAPYALFEQIIEEELARARP